MHLLQVVTFLLLLSVEQRALCNIKLVVWVLYITKLTPQNHELMYLSYKNVFTVCPSCYSMYEAVAMLGAWTLGCGNGFNSVCQEFQRTSLAIIRAQTLYLNTVLFGVEIAFTMLIKLQQN
jgi:hypothetical protein